MLKIGTRPARIVTRLQQVPGLEAACTSGVITENSYDIALEISRKIEISISALGDGPYGRAMAALFGTRPSTRGLLLTQRRREAAHELGVEVATLVRHRERDMIAEIAVSLYAANR